MGHGRFPALADGVFQVLSACVLSLVFLTIKDMYDQANPVIHEVETGIYNLTSNDLEVAVADVDDYIFLTMRR